MEYCDAYTAWDAPEDGVSDPDVSDVPSDEPDSLDLGDTFDADSDGADGEES